jgi:ankyrin repeat protein
MKLSIKICEVRYKKIDNREIYQFKLGQCGRYNDVDKDVVNDKIRLHHITFSNFTISSITVLHIAAYYGATYLVRVLLDCGANVNAKDGNGNAAMHFALAAIVRKKNFFRKTEQPQSDVSSQFEVLKLLTLAGANTDISIHCANFSGYNNMHYDYRPIYLAVVCGELDLVSTFIEYGTDMHFIDAFGHSLLNYAVEQKNHALVKLLLDNGANVNQRYNKKKVLECAIEHEMWYISFLLLMKKYYHDTAQTLPLLYRTMDLCIEEVLSEDLMMENLDNFTSTVVENDYLLEEELLKWESYLQSTYVPSHLKKELNNLCGPGVLEGIVKEGLDVAKKSLEDVVKSGINRFTDIMGKIEQCSIHLERPQSLDSILQTQCSLQQDEYTRNGLQTQYLPKQNENTKKSQSTWQLAAFFPWP